MSTRAALVLGACIVLAACIVTFGPRVGVETAYDSGAVSYLTGSNGPSTTGVSLDAPFRATVTGGFLIVRKASESGRESVHIIPGERVVSAVGVRVGK